MIPPWLSPTSFARSATAYGEKHCIYSSKAYGGLAAWVKSLVDALGAGASPAERARMTERFLLSCRYEHAFWEMAWTKEQWRP